MESADCLASANFLLSNSLGSSTAAGDDDGEAVVGVASADPLFLLEDGSDVLLL